MTKRFIYPATEIYPFHIYNRSIDGLFYPLNTAEVWNECVDLLRICSYAFGARIHAFVLMSNHYHLLATFPDSNMSEAIGYFQRELSRWLLRNTGHQRYRFSGRFKHSQITDGMHFFTVYRYIYNNPVRAGLCDRAELYPYSTLTWRCGGIKESPPVTLVSPLSHFLPEGCVSTELDIVNVQFNEDEISMIKRGLRRGEFQI